MRSDRFTVGYVLRSHSSQILQGPTGDTKDARIQSIRRLQKALKVVHVALSTEARIRIARLAGERNNLMPINKLPLELTAAVLLESMTADDHRDLGRLQRLTQVQTTWWHVIKSHPPFWNTIHVGSLDAAELKLHKSGGMLLDIICHPEATANDLQLFLSSLESRRHRVRSIRYRRRTISSLRALLDASILRLEKLVLLPDSQVVTGVRLSQCSSLKHLELKNVAPRWEGVQIRHLETLVLSRVLNISLPEFAEALKYCPQLKEIDLEHVEANDSALPPDPILLPRLYSLTTDGVGRSFIIPFMSTLRADNLVEFLVVHNRGDPNGEAVFRGLFHAQSTPLSLAALLTNPYLRLQKINLEITDNTLELGGRFANNEAMLRVGLAGVDLGWMRELGPISLPDLGVPFRVIVRDDGGFDEPAVFSINLAPFTTMTRLDLSCGPRLAAVVAPTLFGNTNQWPCPKLEEVHVCLEPPGEWDCGAWEWDVMAATLASLLERRNSEVACAASVAKVTLYVDDQVVTKAEDVKEVIDAFVYEGE